MRRKRERQERERLLLLEPETLDKLCSFIADGKGSLAAWCRNHDVRFVAVHQWLHDDKERLKVYTRTLESRTARLTDKVLDGMEAIIDADPRRAFDKKGRMVQPHRIPDDLARVVTGIERQDGHTAKIRTIAQDRGIELLGRHLGMFRDKVEVEMTDGLSSRLQAARQRASKRK